MARIAIAKNLSLDESEIEFTFFQIPCLENQLFAISIGPSSGCHLDTNE